MEPDADHETDAGHKPDPDDEDVLSRLDALIEPTSEPENAVLTDNAKLVRWAGPMFALFAVILLPWIVYIGITLPSRQLSPNYDIAWTGFDLMLFSALASTAYFALRRSRYLSTAAVASAVLLTADAWFNVMTTRGPSGSSRSCSACSSSCRWPACACGSAITRCRSANAGSYC